MLIVFRLILNWVISMEGEKQALCESAYEMSGVGRILNPKGKGEPIQYHGIKNQWNFETLTCPALAL